MKKEISRFDALGNRMKYFERMETERSVMPSLPVMARLDGRGFHNFTRGLSRPYDERMSRSMIETARYLVEHTHAAFAYTQSDEITLGFYGEDDNANALFRGRIQKLVSVLAGMATAKFNAEVLKRIPEKASLLPCFDARVFNLPNLQVMAECVLFRALDCEKNAKTMAASAYFSHKELQRVPGALKVDMLAKEGVDFYAYPDFFRVGTFVRRESVERTLTDSELVRIPESRRPTGPVTRTEVVEVPVGPFSTVTNPVGFLFFKESPTYPLEGVPIQQVPKRVDLAPA